MRGNHPAGFGFSKQEVWYSFWKISQTFTLPALQAAYGMQSLQEQAFSGLCSIKESFK